MFGFAKKAQTLKEFVQNEYHVCRLLLNNNHIDAHNDEDNARR